MPIITHTKNPNLLYEYLAIFPDQYLTDKEKQGDDFVKQNMDYFGTVAYSQFQKNKKTFVRNYNLLKGILDHSDFYSTPEVKGFIENLEDAENLTLADHVKHYSILNPPINTLVGEMTKRPDSSRVKAFDDDSKNEELAFRTDLLNQYIVQKAREKLLEKLALQGVDLEEMPPEEIEQLTMESIEDQMMAYTSHAEYWGSNVLEALKVQLNIKEKSEDAFRDLLISSREFYHIFETDENDLGVGLEVVNPKNLWYLTTPDKKYSQDWYAGGVVEVMEISQIIERFPMVTKEEIDHLRKNSERFNLMDLTESNYGNQATGIDTIKYDVYDPAILQERMFLESAFQENPDELNNYLGLSSNTSNFGNKFSVVTAYWKSKKKVGKLTYWDQDMQKEATILVDENYVEGSHPFQIEIEWRWMNRWYKGVKIGPDVYHVVPYELLAYCPIIGVVHEIKNTKARSLVDLMKPFQMIYNICMNQLWKLLEKEKGKVFLIPIRHIPIPKDGDAQDALDVWEAEAEERGVLFIDDSPENAKSLSSFNQYRMIDLTRSEEMQARYNLAVQMKMECWQLVGITPERQGQVSAQQTATGVNTSLSQSYAQTENYFVQHEYVLNEVYQALLDAAQFIESKKPTSTLSYINGTGNNAFVQITGDELKLRDLKVFVTSRTKDTEAFMQLKQLAQPAMQNGASLYDIAELYTTDSMRKLKDTFKRLRDRQDEYMASQQQMEQQQLDQQQQQFLAAQQAEDLREREIMINDNYQKELDRVNKKEVALINSFSRQDNNLSDQNNSGVPDILEVSRLGLDETTQMNDHSAALQKIAIEKQKVVIDRDMQLRELEVKKEALRVKEQDIASKERIAKANKNKYDSKSKSKKK